MSLGEVSVSIAPVPGRASAEDARIARELASAASEYAAAVEQLARSQQSRCHGGLTSRAGRQERQFLPPLVSPQVCHNTERS